MSDVVARFEQIEPRAQAADGATYYRKRTPEDSRIDPQRPIAEQFDLLRICDPGRYPAFFDLHGHRYRIRLDKLT
jgi:methionyl-tRNA formyltransferase